MRKLCIRSLRRGVGSKDFTQGLLIMEDDLDEGHEEDESDVTPIPCTSTDLLAVQMLGHQILLHLLATMPYHGASVGCVK